jgi:predicted MFS family arabinose efflux permease
VSAGSDGRLIWCIAIGQTIGWGTLFSVFPLFGAPLEAEFGWSRAEVNAGLTLALLVGGVAAVPFGRMVDRRGGRRILALGAFGGAALLLAWARVKSLAAFWAIWAGMGLVQAAALWGPAMALVVGTAREPARAIAGITFVTGFTGTIFVPLGAGLIEALGWRGALLALAAIQAVPGLLTLAMLPPDPARPATAPRAGFSLWIAVRRPAFLALACCFAAQAFIGVGLGAHAIPLLRERGLPEASVLLGRGAARAVPGGRARRALRAGVARDDARRRAAGDRPDARGHAPAGGGAARARLAGALRPVLGGGRRADDHRPLRRSRGDPGAGGLRRGHRRAQRGDGAAAHPRARGDRPAVGGRRRLRAGALAAGGARPGLGGGLRPGGPGAPDRGLGQAPPGRNHLGGRRRP